jgi:hypothetical protein
MRPLAEEARLAQISSFGRTGGIISENSEIPLYNSAKSATITSDETNDDGGSGSGNFGHNGVPGKLGGSAPGSSAEGENTPCTGFGSAKKLKDHFDRHGADVGASSKSEYEKKGVNFLKQKCGGDVIGYSASDGKVVRFNKKTTEYATGYPGGNLCTYMIPKLNKKTRETRPDKALEYYESRKKEDTE